MKAGNWYSLCMCLIGFSSLIAVENIKDKWLILQNNTGNAFNIRFGINTGFNELIRASKVMVPIGKTFRTQISFKDDIRFIIDRGYSNVFSFTISNQFVKPATQSAVLEVRVNLKNEILLSPLPSFEGVSYPNNITLGEIMAGKM